jgi:hypothetical protein
MVTFTPRIICTNTTQLPPLEGSNIAGYWGPHVSSLLCKSFAGALGIIIRARIKKSEDRGGGQGSQLAGAPIIS